MHTGSGSTAHKEFDSEVHEQMSHHSSLGVPDADMQPDGPLLRAIKDRLLAFLGVGAINTAVGLGVFFAFHHVFGDSRYLVTLLAAHVVSVLVAFVLYRKLVYRVHGQVLHDLWRFETVYLLGLAGNVVLLALGVSVFHVPVLVCQVVITALQAVWSWVGHGRFSFRRPTPSPRSRPDSS